MEFVAVGIVIFIVVVIGAAFFRRRGWRAAPRTVHEPPTSTDTDLPVEPSGDVPGSRSHRERRGRP